ncbi:MAG: hypothetical protein OXR73_16510, partial [Myxococcales bacterium]|nr:hypothetical protein [Myxococcales bacterium]
SYVAGGVLVARFDEVLMGAPPAKPFPLNKVILTGTIEKGDDGVSLGHTQIAARTAISVMLEAFAVDLIGEPRCRLRAEYDLLRNAFCNRVDIRTMDEDASQPCDAVSSVTSLAWAPAQLGTPVEYSDFSRAQAPNDCQMLTCE